MLAATASLGLVLLWDVDGGLTQIDKYLYSSEDYIKSGWRLFYLIWINQSDLMSRFWIFTLIYTKYQGFLNRGFKFPHNFLTFVSTGALLACGIVNTGIRNDCDPALALLSDYVLHSSNVMRIGSILGWADCENVLFFHSAQHKNYLMVGFCCWSYQQNLT